MSIKKYIVWFEPVEVHALDSDQAIDAARLKLSDDAFRSMCKAKEIDLSDKKPVAPEI